MLMPASTDPKKDQEIFYQPVFPRKNLPLATGTVASVPYALLMRMEDLVPILIIFSAFGK
jgi:hypothetical protein